MRTIYIINCLFLVFLSIHCFGKQQYQDRPTISGTFNYKLKAIPDSISVGVYGKNWFEPYTYKKRIKVDRNGKFSFTLPAIVSPVLIMLYRQRTDHSGKLDQIGEYLVEPNDNIKLKFFETASSDSLVFSGPGSTKYNLIYRITTDFHNFEYKVGPGLKLYLKTDSNTLRTKLIECKTLIKALHTKKQFLIDHSKLDKQIKSLINYEFANYLNRWQITLWWQYQEINAGYPTHQSIVLNFYNKYSPEFKYTQDKVMASCPYFVYRESNTVSYDLYFNSKGNQFTLEDQYNAIKNNYSDALKQALIMDFFSGNAKILAQYDQAKSDSLAADACNISADLKAFLIPKLRLKKGATTYESAFTDLNDSTFTISSLKEKVVLVDIWGTGCSGCAGFHKIFEDSIRPVFKNNKNFVLLSINTDKQKERWKSSVAKGIYTSKEDLCVYTNGLGLDHPFTKYYAINSAPFLFLLDKNQKIYAKISPSSTKPGELIRLIKMALNEPNQTK